MLAGKERLAEGRRREGFGRPAPFSAPAVSLAVSQVNCIHQEGVWVDSSSLEQGKMLLEAQQVCLRSILVGAMCSGSPNPDPLLFHSAASHT